MISAEYSIDTNSILTAWNTAYRPKSFPKFWINLEDLVRDGKALISEEVHREVLKKDDEVAQWLKGLKPHIVALEEEQILLTQALAKRHPHLAKERLGRQHADGFVIALAQWKGLKVVTYENNRGGGKIPNICAAESVECMALPDLIEAEGWTF